MMQKNPFCRSDDRVLAINQTFQSLLKCLISIEYEVIKGNYQKVCQKCLNPFIE